MQALEGMMKVGDKVKSKTGKWTGFLLRLVYMDRRDGNRWRIRPNDKRHWIYKWEKDLIVLPKKPNLISYWK